MKGQVALYFCSPRRISASHWLQWVTCPSLTKSLRLREHSALTGHFWVTCPLLSQVESILPNWYGLGSREGGWLEEHQRCYKRQLTWVRWPQKSLRQGLEHNSHVKGSRKLQERVAQWGLGEGTKGRSVDEEVKAGGSERHLSGPSGRPQSMPLSCPCHMPWEVG